VTGRGCHVERYYAFAAGVCLAFGYAHVDERNFDWIAGRLACGLAIDSSLQGTIGVGVLVWRDRFIVAVTSYPRRLFPPMIDADGVADVADDRPSTSESGRVVANPRRLLSLREEVPGIVR